MVVEPCAMCYVCMVCLGVAGYGIYILGDNICMGGAMRGWCWQVFYFGVFLCLLMCTILKWGGLVGRWLVCILPYCICWCGGCLCVYLCSMIVDGGN